MTTTTSKRDEGSVTNGFLANPEIARRLALGAVISPILFTLAWIILGLMRPAIKNEWGVSGGVTGMITQPFSGLGLGINGSLFNAAFLLNGILIMAGVFGIFQIIEAGGRPAAHKTSAVLLALSGLGSVMCAVFTLESFFLHMIGFSLGTGVPVLGFLVTGFFLRGIPHWRKFGSWLLAASPLTLALLVLFFLNFNYDTMAAGLGIAGLTERILVIEVQAWYMTMGWLAFRHSQRLALPL